MAQAPAPCITCGLCGRRVSVRSVQRWRRAWSQNGPRAPASKGPVSLPLLSDELFAVLEREPAVAGWVKEAWPSVEGPWRRSTPGSPAPGPAAATPR
ncbi:hypothetical protein ACFWIJ_11445 [Streptomyces sp. NPDC127079]|uniref:hypothetical protein n=1 Tax=Streptomyces sp. NPDC127079 TaxID=3347132 RepID=UPI003651E9A4